MVRIPRLSGGTRATATVLSSADLTPPDALGIFASGLGHSKAGREDDSAMRCVAATGGLRGFDSRHRGGEASTPPSKGWRVTRLHTGMCVKDLA